MKVFYFFLIILPLISTAQGNSDLSENRHSIEISPISITLNKAFFIGQALRYKFQLSKSFFVDGTTDGILIKKLDARAWYFSDESLFPRYNQSKIVVGYQIPVANRKINPLKNKKMGIHVGYHYVQHGTQSREYWLLDSISNGGATIISGFKTNSIIFGLEFHSLKNKIKQQDTLFKWRHNFYMDYLYSLKTTITGFNDYDSYTEKTEIMNKFPLHRNGFRLSYSFDHGLTKHFGLSYGTEVLWAPFINYSYNDEFVVPRGGERIIPLFVNVKIALLIESHRR